MANLSNINGKFVVEQTTGYVGIGITDPSQLLHLQSTADTILKIDNITSGTGKSYLLQSTTAGSFVIRDEDASSNRLLINTSGNATFAGTISSGAITASGSTAAGVLTLESTAASDLTITTTAANTWEFSNAGNNSVYNGYSHTFKNGATTGLTINNSGNATFSGSVTANSLTIDDITINGSTISDAGNFTIDVGGDISLDSANGTFRLKDGGTEFAKISENSNNLRIFSSISDGDILLQGNDGGSTITALTLDMSDGGSATFRDDIDFGGKLTQTGTGNNTFAGDIVMGDNDITGIDQLIFTSGTYFTDVSSNYVELRYASTAAGGMIILDGDGTTQGYLYADGGATSNFGLLHGSGSWAVRCKELAEVELRYNNSVKLATTSTGVTVSGTVSATTFSGDLNGSINTVTTATTKGNSTNDTTVATTAFVQNVISTIPAGLVFQGTWNASTNSPTLTSGSGTTGNFYIVSTAGTTNLDGITDWQVGDWAVFIEQGASDQWEKIDNSSVLSGAGTGGSFAGWSGSGTSVTLGNAPVTFSGNNSTFAGDVTVTGGDLTLGTDSIASNINAVGDVLGINVDSNTGGGASANIQLKTAGTTQLTINSSSATFAQNVGIGITPSASFSGVEVLQLGKGMTIFGNTNDDRATMASNLILNTGTAFEYVMDGLAGKFSIEDGNMSFGTAPSGTAGAVATVTERMRIDSSGTLTVGAQTSTRLVTTLTENDKVNIKMQ